MEHLLIGAANARITKLSTVQRPGGDELLSSVVIGGPTDRKDRVMVLSVTELEHLMKVARESPTRRVELPLVGLRVDTYRGEGTRGNYEVWKLTSAKPRPESAGVLTGLERE